MLLHTCNVERDASKKTFREGEDSNFCLLETDHNWQHQVN